MCTGLIWRGIGFEVFMLPSRVHACRPEVNAKCWADKQKFQYRHKMEYEIRIYNEEKYVEIVTRGVADKDGSLSMAKTIKETMQQHRMTRALIDHRNIESVSGETMEIYNRPKLFRIMGVVLNIKIAEIIKPDHVKHFRFFETVCINQGIRLSIFQEKTPALEWLLK